MEKTFLHVIVEVSKGLHEEAPKIFSTEDIAGQYFESMVVQKGFRLQKKKETWQNYVVAFQDWEESSACTYDRMDFEIHWWQNIPLTN